MAVIIDENQTVLENIDVLKDRLKNGQLDYQNYEKEAKEIYASIFALRSSVNAERNKKSTLRYTPKKEVFDQQKKDLLEDKNFDAFVKKHGTEKINQWIAGGHGGAVEAEYQEYLKTSPRLSEKTPKRYMPSAKERIDSLQKELKNKDSQSADAFRIYAEIFRARRSVGALHSDKSRLEANISGENYGKAPDLEKNETFKKFAKEKGEELKALALKGHGGEAEKQFRAYVTNLDHVPTDVPKPYGPTALERTEALQKKMKSADFNALPQEKKQALYKKIFEDIFAEDPDTDRLSKYLNGTMSEKKNYPPIRYGGITMEPAERTITGGVPNELKGRHHRFYNIGGKANEMFVAEVLNTESMDELFSFWMSRYLKAQMKARPCKYCGRLFVPFLRQDSEYCDRLIEVSTKTCKEMGAIRLYERRKVEEPAVKEYKRSYKTHFARIAYGRMTEEEFKTWSERARELRDRCREGQISLVEFIAWLDSDKLR